LCDLLCLLASLARNFGCLVDDLIACLPDQLHLGMRAWSGEACRKANSERNNANCERVLVKRIFNAPHLLAPGLCYA
jgi:hypothetical protein